jgi:hypothetical protein
MMWNWKWVVEEVERRNEGQGNSMEVIPITCWSIYLVLGSGSHTDDIFEVVPVVGDELVICHGQDLPVGVGEVKGRRFRRCIHYRFKRYRFLR